MAHNIYYDETAMAQAATTGDHRRKVGGLWDAMGALQLDFLKAEGLQPGHTLLDVGCGALRLGRLAINYLEPNHYFGMDLSESLLAAGYDQELTAEQRARLSRDHLVQSSDFDFSALPGGLDVAIAQSVFTHLPLNHLRRCLIKLAPQMAAGGRFYVTYFECPEHQPLAAPLEHPGQEGGNIVTSDVADPYHYRVADLEWAAREAPWTWRRLGDWGHPRGQLMGVYIRHDR